MDDDTSRATDLAEAWPEEDDLSLGAEPAAEPTLTEVSNEPTADKLAEPGADPGEGAEPSGDPSGDRQDPNDPGLPDGGEPAGAAPEGDSPNAGSPVSWSATAREQWKDIPKEAQEYIKQRETEMAQGMQKNAEQANRATQMDRTLQPYQQYLAMNGGPGATIQNLLQTGAGLQMGTPQQKVQIVANLINQFGIDIASLDNLITGGAATPEVAQTSQMEAMINQRLAPMQQQLAQYQQRDQQMQQGVQQEAGSDVTTFAQDAKNEFYNDVRGDMADILDMSANRGINLSLKQAYDKACQLNPEIGRIIQSREQARQLATKRRAAASVSGTMGGPGASATPESMRGTIEAAWDTQGQI